MKIWPSDLTRKFIYFVGSVSPRRSHFDDYVEQHVEAIRSALNNASRAEGSSSGKVGPESGDWISFEDEADACYEGC